MPIMRRLVTKVTVTLQAITAVTMYVIRTFTVQVITAVTVHAVRTFTVHVIMVVAGVTTRVIMAVRVSVIACHTAYRGTASRLQLLP
ncbi:hypothetical protein ACIGW8_13715 [Streptomyces sioyaensis]|uniref:hypothetical protein n=1 Tax=Streptomyces sioyaensis TaxID=67364 RepID=UPI0037D6E438